MPQPNSARRTGPSRGWPAHLPTTSPGIPCFTCRPSLHPLRQPSTPQSPLQSPSQHPQHPHCADIWRQAHTRLAVLAPYPLSLLLSPVYAVYDDAAPSLIAIISTRHHHHHHHHNNNNQNTNDIHLSFPLQLNIHARAPCPPCQP